MIFYIEVTQDNSVWDNGSVQSSIPVTINAEVPLNTFSWSGKNGILTIQSATLREMRDVGQVMVKMIDGSNYSATIMNL